MKNIYIIGVGLIGGSLAIDIKKNHPEMVIHGISRKEATLDEALALKLIDKKATLDDIVDADSIMVTNSLFGIINVIKVDKNSYQPWANTIAVAQKLQTTLS